MRDASTHRVYRLIYKEETSLWTSAQISGDTGDTKYVMQILDVLF